MAKIQNILICIAISCLFIACKDEPSSDGDFLYNFVTYDGYADGANQFSFQAKDDSPLVTLRTSQNLTLKWNKGKRTLINYSIIDKKDGKIQEIRIKDITNVIFDSLRLANKENIGIGLNTPLQLKSIWRTGNFINIDCNLLYTDKARQFMLVMDESTWNSEVVDVYVLQNLFGAQTYAWRRAFASFFVGNIWYLPTCKTIRVHLNDEKYPAKYYDFSKK
ncbi:MAG: NigD-like C-terminal domain-containing protein [Muribaculaceae bacterium]